MSISLCPSYPEMNHYVSHYPIIIIFILTLVFELLFHPLLITYIHCDRHEHGLCRNQLNRSPT
jgi:hypothetical protein